MSDFFIHLVEIVLVTVCSSGCPDFETTQTQVKEQQEQQQPAPIKEESKQNEHQRTDQ